MVSLRERKARPSYSNIPEGLQNLTSSDEDSEAPAAGPSGSRIPARRGSGSSHPSAGSAAGSPIAPAGPRDEEDSVSSGDSSEFAPSDSDLDKKKRGRPRGSTSKGRSTSAREASEATSGYADEQLGDDSDAAEELKELGDVEGEEEDSEEDGMDLDSLKRGKKAGGRGKKAINGGTAGARPKSKKSVPYGGSDRPPGRPLAAAPAYIQSDINLVPTAYRQLIKTAAESMVRAPPARVWTQGEAKKADLMGFPSGSGIPFTTRLETVAVPSKKNGKGKQQETTGREERRLVVEPAGPMVDRRRRAVQLEKGLTVGIGREAWEGEGFWREMYDPSMGEGEGSEILPNMEETKGWKLRQEVRLGLDDVGRMDLAGIKFLSGS
jgi:hypothetical protein